MIRLVGTLKQNQQADRISNIAFFGALTRSTAVRLKVEQNQLVDVFGEIGVASMA
jgi:hypothetical protein